MLPRLQLSYRSVLVLLVLALSGSLLCKLYFANAPTVSLVLGNSNTAETTAYAMNRPHGIAFDPTSGSLFVAASDNNRVLRFDAAATRPNGASADSTFGWNEFATFDLVSGISGPYNLATDNTGRLWVSDEGNNHVVRFDVNP